MPTEDVPFALRAATRSRLGKLILVYIVAHTAGREGEEDYVPCLTYLARLAEVGQCSEAEAADELHALKDGGFLTYLAVYPEGQVCVEPILPTVVPLAREPGDGA